MKRLYWRPQRISRRVLAVLAVVALGGLLAVETFQIRKRQPFYRQKIRAARLCKRAYDGLKEERIRRKIPIVPEADPAQTGIIGQLLTPVTTNPGHLPAKQTSVNPNWAAVVVHLLKRAGVEKGDLVAVGMSGSFPAINVAVLSAMKALHLQPIIVSSAGSSQWGSNVPGFMWPDMERILVERRLFPFESAAYSRGGIDDRALGLSREGKALIDAEIQKNRFRLLTVRNYTEGLRKRIEIIRQRAAGREIAAYVNVGGGTTSVGTKVGKRMFKPGLNRSPPRGVAAVDSVMARFALQGVPVIHLVRIDTLAQRYGLPLQPTITPPVGEGKIFVRRVRSTGLALGVLAVLILMLFGLLRMDWGHRLFAGSSGGDGPSRPEPMI